MTERSTHVRHDQPGTGQPSGEPSVGELLGDLSHELSQLMRQEVELAKTEVRAQVGRATRSAALLTGAAVAGYLTVLLASLAAAWALGELVSVAGGLLIVALIHLAVAIALYVLGRRETSRIELVPNQTIETLKEDARWARAQPK